MLGSAVTQSDIKDKDYADFCVFLEQACGIVLGDNKHYLVKSRLNRLMQEFSFTSLGAMLDALKRDARSGLRERTIDAMTTNETMWFRDTYPYDILKQVIFAEMAKQRGRATRIWSAACSSGQESYSISMCVSEYQQANPGSLTGDVQIVATDISPTVLNMAKQATYDGLSVVRGLSEERKRRFFTKKGDAWEVRPEIRNRARFTELNLLKSYVLLGRFDVIFCRNVLIYFSNDLKRDILTRMAQALNPGGFLLLGGSESPTGYTDAFEMVRSQQGVFYRLKAGWKPAR